uniref:Uncharacterized protein n=1 Tax=Zonotrichia albicollis TaxID=44394 RepID=A0A8D2MBY1_ZONAL
MASRKSPDAQQRPQGGLGLSLQDVLAQGTLGPVLGPSLEHTALLRGTLPGEAATSTEWEGTCQPLPCHGLWSRDTKPGLSWGQPGMVGVRGYVPLYLALMKLFMAAEMGFQMQKFDCSQISPKYPPAVLEVLIVPY